MPRMNDTKITKALRQIPPCNARAIAVKHCIYKKAVVFTRSTDVSSPAGQKVFDAIPLCICQSVSTSHTINNEAAIEFDDTP